MKKDRIAIITAILLILGSLVASRIAKTLHFEEEEVSLHEELTAILDIASVQDTAHTLVTGYHHQLLKNFAKDHGMNMKITLSDLDSSPIDSLLDGCCDILVTTLLNAPISDSTLFSIPIDSTIVWVMLSDKEPEMIAANIWLGKHFETARDSMDREKYFHPYGYRYLRGRGYLSPYDSLLRAEADTLGWDWRMLAAVIFHESRFHIEAKSYRGAMGLSQLIPSTAAHFGCTDALDPEENIHAGALCLRSYAGRYKEIGDNRTEWFKYTLAAFNAGPGRIDDVINYALYRGKDPSYWINVVAVIPEMNDESVLETGVVKIGTFKGVETIAYVDSVIQIYNRICEICPE